MLLSASPRRRVEASKTCPHGLDLALDRRGHVVRIEVRDAPQCIQSCAGNLVGTSGDLVGLRTRPFQTVPRHVGGKKGELTIQLACQVSQLANQAWQLTQRRVSGLRMGYSRAGPVDVVPEFAAQHERLAFRSRTRNDTGAEPSPAKVGPRGCRGHRTRNDLEGRRDGPANSCAERADPANNSPAHHRERHQCGHDDRPHDQCDISTCHDMSATLRPGRTLTSPGGPRACRACLHYHPSLSAASRGATRRSSRAPSRAGPGAGWSGAGNRSRT